MKQIFIRNSIIQFILLFGFWLLLSGHYDFFHIALGVISSLAIMLFNIKIRGLYHYRDEIFKTSGLKISLNYFRYFFFYIPWLIWQIIVASIQVAYVVLRPKMPIDPALVRFKTKLPTIGSKVILGNSITLTPGTITIQVEKDEFIVHALMDASSSGIIDGSLPEQVARLYEKKPGQVVNNIEIIKSSKEL